MFCDWLISVSVRFSRTIYVVTWITNSIPAYHLILQSELQRHLLSSQHSFKVLAILMLQAPKWWDYICGSPFTIHFCFLVGMFRLFTFNVFIGRIMVAPFCCSHLSYSLPLFCFVLHWEIISIYFIFFWVGSYQWVCYFSISFGAYSIYIFSITLCGQMVFHL